MNAAHKRKNFHYWGFAVCLLVMVPFIVPNPLMLGTASLNGVSTVEAQSGFDWIWDEYVGAPGSIDHDDVVYWGSDLGPFHNYGEINTHIASLASSFPDYVSVQTIGASYEYRNIRCVVVTAPGDSSNRHGYLLVAHHHGRECITIENALFILDYLIANRDSPSFAQILQNFVIYIIPTLNPDSLTEIYVNPWHRKTLRPTDEDGDGTDDEGEVQDINGDNWVEYDDLTDDYEGYDLDGDGEIGEDLVGGIDLNRNYPVGWDLGSSVPRSQAYHGSAPFSEPETQTMRNFAEQHPELVFAMSLHSGIAGFFTPWFTNATFTPDESLFARIAADITDASGYPRLAQGGTQGIWDDWMYGVMGVLAMTLETYGNSAAWGYSIWDLFNPSADEVISNCERVWEAFAAVFETLFEEYPPASQPSPLPFGGWPLPLVIGVVLMVGVSIAVILLIVWRKRKTI